MLPVSSKALGAHLVLFLCFDLVISFFIVFVCFPCPVFDIFVEEYFVGARYIEYVILCTMKQIFVDLDR